MGYNGENTVILVWKYDSFNKVDHCVMSLLSCWTSNIGRRKCATINQMGLKWQCIEKSKCFCWKDHESLHLYWLGNFYCQIYVAARRRREPDFIWSIMRTIIFWNHIIIFLAYTVKKIGPGLDCTRTNMRCFDFG